jgi:hypothetical protein
MADNRPAVGIRLVVDRVAEVEDSPLAVDRATKDCPGLDTATDTVVVHWGCTLAAGLVAQMEGKTWQCGLSRFVLLHALLARIQKQGIKPG